MKPHALNTHLNEYEYRQGRLTLQSWPQIIDLGLTLKCNLDCVMCFTRLLPAIDLDRECLDKVIPYLDVCHQITWNDAGEIFASSRTREFVDLIKRYHPPVSYVSTNFQLIDRYLDDVLDSGLTDISVSVDAARRETYERIRTGARWDKLIANLEQMQRRKAARGTEWPRVTLVFVPMRSNLAELAEFVDFARKYGAFGITVLKMLPTPKSLELIEEPPLEEERAAYETALRRARELGLEIQHSYFNNNVLLGEMARESTPRATESATAQVFPAPVGAAVEPPGLPPRVPLETLHRRQFDPASGNVPICPAPWREFLIQTDGKVRACCFSPAVMGDLHAQSLPEIWNGAEFQAFRRRLVVRDFSTCARCPYLAKVLAVGGDALEQSLVSMERELAEQGRWLTAYLNDVNQLFDWTRKLRAGQWKAALREWKPALKAAARVTGKNFFVKPAMARAWAESRRLNQRLVETARLAQQRARRLREDAEILAEVAALRGDAAAGERRPGGAAGLASPSQDPLDALFYRARFVRHETPPRLKCGSEITVRVAVQNAGAVEWPTEGDSAVKLAYSWYHENGALFQLDGLRTRLTPAPKPGETVELHAVVRAPERPGRYLLTWDLVYDPYAWFKNRGGLPLEVEVLVEP